MMIAIWQLGRAPLRSLRQSSKKLTGRLQVLAASGVVLSATVVYASESAIPVAADESERLSDSDLSALLMRTTVLDLGLRQIPGPVDYQMAAALLMLASDLDETNPHIARSVVEAAWAAGDEGLLMSATRRVVKNDPRDTVAQLRLISSVINKQQTVEGRLRLYDRFIDENSGVVDNSVKSRLSLDAALLEREQGNADGFVERLRQATKLDISNKSAASLTAQFYSQATIDPVTQLEYQFKLLFADPLDPHVHLTIVNMLAREGAFVQAQRFLENATELFKLDTGEVPVLIKEARITVNWQVDGPDTVLNELNPELETLRAQVQDKIDVYIKAQLPTDDLLKPEDIRYDLSIDKLRLLAAYNTDNLEETQAVLDDIELTITDDLTAVVNRMNQRGSDSTQLLTQIVTKLADFQVMRAVVGLEAEEIRKDIDKIVKQVPGIGPYFAGFEPLALYAEGQYEASLISASRFNSSVILNLIRALASEKLAKNDDAIMLYVQLCRDEPLSAYGAFARSRLIKMGEGERTLSDAGREMIKIAATIPNWLDQMNTRPGTFMYLDMDLIESKIDPVTMPMLRIRLRNLAPIPLAIGPSHPIDSRFLIESVFDSQTLGFQGEVSAKSKVYELNNRLRLMPREEVLIEIPADSMQANWLLTLQANNSIRQRWRLLQGFRPRVSDTTLARSQVNTGAAIYGIVNSPLGLTAETKLALRLVLDETRFTVDQLIEQFGNDDEALRWRAVVASAGRLMLPATDAQLTQSDQAKLIEGLVELYSRADVVEQAKMILVLPHRHQVPEMMAFDDHVVGALVSDALIDSRVDEMVYAVALLTRTDAVDSPMFDLLDQISDPRIKLIAGIIRARLEHGKETMSLVGPGVDSMIREKEYFGL
jgi:hypothetical protein